MKIREKKCVVVIGDNFSVILSGGPNYILNLILFP